MASVVIITTVMTPEEVEYTVAGLRGRLKRTDVVRKLKGVAPGPIREHTVEIGGVLFPIKQAFACATGVDVLDFTTNQARRVFKRLGFEVTRVA